MTVLDPSEVPDDALVIPTAQMGAPTVGARAPAAGRSRSAPSAARGAPRRDRHRDDADRVRRHQLDDPAARRATWPARRRRGRHGPCVPRTADGDVLGLRGAGVPARDQRRERARRRDRHRATTTVRWSGSPGRDDPARRRRVHRRVRHDRRPGARDRGTPRTLSLALSVARDPSGARGAPRPRRGLAEAFGQTIYTHLRELFDGKVVDVERRTVDGFAKGRAVVQGARRLRAEIAFQNENLVARRDGRLVAVVPDLICVLDAETAEPITTERCATGSVSG